MTIALWCILIAGLLPFVFAAVAKAGAEDFDNHSPRAWAARLSGYRQRAWWAQENSFEAFPLFAAAVLVAHVTQGVLPAANALAIAFIAFRIAYGICYLADYHLARSLMWLGGLLCIVGLFILAA